MSQLICVLCIIACFIFSPLVMAKKRCKPLLEKLHKVQALQRSGYSKNKGISLRKREDKARDQWWQCENSSAKQLNKSTKKTKRKAKKKRKKTKAVGSAKVKNINFNKTDTVNPFKTNSPIVVRSKYKGEKKQAWLLYYQQPSQCMRPKNLSIFAYCTEDKQKQRADFEESYKE
ncbi:hypothetical protein L3081_18105 [Colwellia sp. MSW7]|uniref:Secreted protein n=1 Tax=Colwellia maritima TaxID=2912588 RepID=A0ABS9X3Y2_9GAMM|nr:hypothetical protein [Colwellia maritima]MCI2284954.1 hypothetical protein [Colwellia maritima]